jgi:hypothetical protein
MKTMSKMIMCIAIMVCIVSIGEAAIKSVASGDWNNSATWDAGIPTSTDAVYLTGGYAVTNNSAGSIANLIRTGVDGAATLNVISGDLSSSGGDITAGHNGGSSGTINLTGGTITTAANKGTYIGGVIASAKGTLNISGGTFTAQNTRVGIYGEGVMNLSGSGVLSVNALDLGYYGGSTGIVNMTGGTLETINTVNIGKADGSYAELNLSGGTFSTATFKALNIGPSGTGKLKISGTDAVITLGDAVNFGANAFFEAALSSDGVTTVTGGNDKAITLDGALVLSALTGVSSVPSSVTLFQTQGSGAISGTFDTVDWGNLSGDLVYTDEQVRIDNLEVIPEPVTIGLFVLSGFVIFVMRRHVK